MNSSQLKLKVLTPLFRSLPIGLKGKSRLARYLFNAALKHHDISIVARDGARYLVPSLTEPIGFYLLIDGIYEKSAIDFIIKILPPRGTFLDIGANIGVFAVTVAKSFKNPACVVAIEASPKVATYLHKNIKANDLKNVKIFELAATDIDNSTVAFYEPPDDHFGMGSIAPQFHNSPIRVMTKTIDTLLNELKVSQVDVIKVDVEGYESIVFKGARDILSKPKAPIIIFEFCDWAEDRAQNLEIGDAQRILVEFGYKIWRLNDILNQKKPLNHIVEHGSDTLIAIKSN